MNDEANNILDYRLQSIEHELKSLKELLVTVPILNNDLQNLEHRIETAETNIDILNKEISMLKNEPIRKSADKWKFITDFIFKSIVAIVVGWALIRIGLQ